MSFFLVFPPAPSDFLSISQSLTFDAFGLREQCIDIEIVNDNDAEDTERFFFELSLLFPPRVTIPVPMVPVDILDDDPLGKARTIEIGS